MSELRRTRISDPEVERDFRAATVGDDARAAAVGMVIAVIPFAAYARVDWLLYGSSSRFGALIVVRIGFIVLSLAAIAISRRIRRPARLDALVLGWIACGALAIGYIHATRPSGFVFPVLVDVLSVVAVWALLPIRFDFQALGAALVSAMSLATFAVVPPATGDPARTSLAIGVGLANLIGAGISWNGHRTRRLRYLARRSADRALADLGLALTQLSSLRGLVTICAGCKDIRGPDGTWHRLDELVSSQTGTIFSHGLCEKCLALRYPGG